MAKEKVSQITKELQDTVLGNPHIEKVHFFAGGGHTFNAHKTKDGIAYGRIHRETKKNMETNVERKIEIPLLHTKIIETWDREEVLSANATYPKKSMISLASLSAEDVASITGTIKESLMAEDKAAIAESQVIELTKTKK